MSKGCDMIVGLYQIPEENYFVKPQGSVKIKRAFVGEKQAILGFIGEHFGQGWIYEAEHALMDDVSKCFIATDNGKVVGFACYDSSAKGMFGPIGVDPARRGEGIGEALLLRTLLAMREYGYAYAIIGWVSEAEQFYRKCIQAEFIPGAYPENSVYSNLIEM